ncbi:hypothetical protein AVEN_61802-1 [Araneus ventricosus]|uniref:Uncharacterized protein n=1 Tax=Araneus ventricosus TaxID=182803 RepID=A0A4Y2AL52_ARAVE|nr:hypothetical protein AVEN_227049-1 [Araneus ventricosus]GBL81412.1 hypothetical protein AVEN_61802-1 [Araneus ventricosus]
MLPVMALSTGNGDTDLNVSLQVEIRFIRKKVGKFVNAEDFDAICCPLKGPDFFPMRHLLGFRPDGTAHLGAQQGKAATGSGYSQPRR